MWRFENVKVCLLVLTIGVAWLSQHLADPTPYWHEDSEAGETGVLPVAFHST